MKKQILKIGFIGGGINSAVGKTHWIACQMDKRWELTAGCFSDHHEINVDTAQSYGIDDEHVYDDWKNLLEAEKNNLDAVVILTPTPLHKEIAIKALEMGYPVICEKALTASCAEAMEIKKTIDENNSFFAVTYNYTGYPMLRELKAMIQTGKLGNITQMQVEMPQEGYIRLNSEGAPNIPQDWRLKDYEIPTLSLDLGVHLHNIIYFLTEKQPVDLVATQNSNGNFSSVIDTTMCLANYTDDLVCQIWYGKAALGQRNGLKVRVFGDAGSAEWLQMEPEVLKYSDKKGSNSILDRSSCITKTASASRYERFKPGHPAGFIEAFANYYCDLADCLIKYQNDGAFSSPYVFDVNHAVEGLQMLEAINDSANKNTWIHINNA